VPEGERSCVLRLTCLLVVPKRQVISACSSSSHPASLSKRAVWSNGVTTPGTILRLLPLGFYSTKGINMLVTSVPFYWNEQSPCSGTAKVSNKVGKPICYPSNYHRRVQSRCSVLRRATVDPCTQVLVGNASPSTFEGRGPTWKPRLSTNSSAAAVSSFVMSSRRTGCYTMRGVSILNVASYAATAAPVVNKNGQRIYNPANYQRKVQSENILKAAKIARAANPLAKAFSYVVYLRGKKAYCGYTCNPVRRFRHHIAGTGAMVTQECPPESVKIYPHDSVATAKQAEKKLYYEQKKHRGADHVRGAGRTTRFSKSLKMAYASTDHVTVLRLLQSIDSYSLIL
jgi:predicted GIY-YIG superfamily endonuclease